MVRLLLFGDLHLSTTGPPVPLAFPNLNSLQVDGIVTIGDVIDDNVDHADDTSSGAAYENRGSAFFSRLNDVGVPVVAVPGNHDPVECTRRITDGLDNVIVAHRRVIDGATLQATELDGVYIVGWGCEKFDLTPAFRYDQYQGIVPEKPGAEDHTLTARESAAAVEAVISRFLAGDLDGMTAATELGVAPSQRKASAKDLEALAHEFEAIRSLLAEAAGTTLLLSHESPFNVAFDYHHSADCQHQRLHRGSIPLKMAIAATGPDVVFSGHTHSVGHDVIETVDGYSDLYNPGSPGVAVAEIDTDAGSLQVLNDSRAV